MKKRLFTTFIVIAGCSLVISIRTSTVYGMWDFDRHWVGRQGPEREERDDSGREEAREAAEEKARQERQERYDEIVGQEHAAHDRKDYQEALRLALQRQALRDGPNVRASIALYRGKIADQAGDYQTAIRYFEETLSAVPENADFVEKYKKWVDEEKAAAARRAVVEQKIRDVADAVNDNKPVAASSMEIIEANTLVVPPDPVEPPAVESHNTPSKDIQTAKSMLSPEVIRERTSEPNEQLRKIMRSLKTKEPPSPVKNIANLAPGDVVLVAPLPSPGVFGKLAERQTVMFKRRHE